VARYGRFDLLCLDELGYVQLDPWGAELLFQIVTEREEKASIAAGSNLPFSEWGVDHRRPSSRGRHRRPAHFQRAHHRDGNGELPAAHYSGGEDDIAILRMLVDRHHDLTRLRTQAVCRLHATLANLVPGGLCGALTTSRTSALLASVRPVDGVVAEPKTQARELLGDVRRLDADIKAIKARVTVAVEASKTSLTDIYGVGPIVAALILGHAGDVARFASRHHFASYNGSAPIEASSGPKKRHRLNPRGNRQLNHALHIAAICQIRFDTPGRTYYRRKIEEGKTTKEALRSLKRRLSDAVYRQLVVDSERSAG